MRALFVFRWTISFVLTVTIGFSADKSIRWEYGKVISQHFDNQHRGEYAGPYAGGAVTVPIYRTVNYVAISSGEYTYNLAEGERHLIVLPVGDEIRFYRDGDKFIFLDAQKRKHKFVMIGQHRNNE